MTPRAYYNEHDKYAAAWLRNLIEAGHIAPGEVDERSIEDVTPNDLAGFTQCHFFAGIGGWSLAARHAGIPDSRPLWTGSCPCQPFSPAGKRAGFDDERHLWPAWHWLIRQCRPDIVAGEQVAKGGGLDWLDLVALDLEGEGFAVTPFDLCAAGFGGWHIRNRIFFTAVADADDAGSQGWGILRQRGAERSIGAGGLAGGLADATLEQQQGAGQPGARGWGEYPDSSAVVWIPCRDGKFRPTEPGLFPLAHGATQRVGRLRAYGNCIHIPTATAFLRSLL